MPFKYKRKEDKELKQVALDLLEGRVFSSNQVENAVGIQHVFMPLALLSVEDRNEMADQNIVFVYEYMEKAIKMAINGMPMFASCSMLNQEDYDRMMEYMKSVAKVLEENERKLDEVMKTV